MESISYPAFILLQSYRLWKSYAIKVFQSINIRLLYSYFSKVTDFGKVMLTISSILGFFSSPNYCIFAPLIQFVFMSEVYVKNKNFKGENYLENILAKGDYESCIFSECNFLNSDLSEISFHRCEFINCDLSMATITDTAFKNVKFQNCKLLGLRFDKCDSFNLSFQFENCILSFASFFKLKLKNIRFVDCKLNEVDFSKTDLTNSIFTNCDLDRAAFDDTNLENADLGTAFNFSINPEANRIKKAKFSHNNISGLLHKYDISID